MHAIALDLLAMVPPRPVPDTLPTRAAPRLPRCATCYQVTLLADSLTQWPPAHTDGHTIGFTLWNDGTATDTYRFSCRTTGDVVCTGIDATELTVPPEGERRIVATYAVGAMGGALTLVATGVVGDTAAVLVATQPRAPLLALANRPDDQRTEGCLAHDVGGVTWRCSDLVAAHTLPSVQRLGRAHTVGVLYRTSVATPQPLFVVHATQPPGVRPSAVQVTLQVGESAAVLDTVVTATYDGWGDAQGPSTRQLALGFSAHSLPTGRYHYRLTVANLGVGDAATSTLTGEWVLVNRTLSRFGRGWAILGVEQLVVRGDDEPLLWIGGDGAARRYAWDSSAAGWVAPAAGFRDVIRRDGPGFVRDLRYGDLVRYDSAGRHIETRTHAGQSTTLTWGAGDSLLAITLPPDGAGGQYTMAYREGLLERITDPTGRALDLTQEAGRPVAVRDPDGEVTGYGYDADGRVQARTNRQGFTTAFVYEQGVGFTGADVPFGVAPAMATTRFLNATEAGLVRGRHPTLATAAPLAEVRSRIDGPRPGPADTTVVTLDPWGQPRTITDPMGAVTTIGREHPAFPALPTRVRGADGHRREVVYDATSPRARVLELWDNSYAPDTVPRLVERRTYHGPLPDLPDSLVDALGRVTRLVWNPLGLPDTLIDARGQRTALDWHTAPEDPRRGLLARATALAVETWPAVPGHGDDAGLADSAVAQTTHYAHDALGNVQAVTSPVGVVAEVAHDSAGRPWRLWDPLGTQTEWTYDAMNRVTAVRRATTRQTPPSGLVLGATMPCDAGQVVCRDLTAPFDAGFPAVVVDSAVYGPAGVIEVLGPAVGGIRARRTYGYEARGRVAWEGDGLGQRDEFTWDAAGDLVRIARRRPGDVVTRRYDLRGQLVEEVVPAADGTPADTLRIAYDHAGRDSVRTNRHATLERRYRRGGALAQQVLRGVGAGGGGVDTLQLQYSGAGERTTRLHSQTVGWTTRDSVGYVWHPRTGTLDTLHIAWRGPGSGGSVVTRPRLATFTWDALGRRRTLTTDLGGGVTVQYRYDRLGVLRRVQARHAVPTPHGDAWQFTLGVDSVDAVGRPLAQWAVCTRRNAALRFPYDACAAGEAHQWRHDRLGTLAWQGIRTAEGSTVGERVTIDPAGNVVQRVRTGAAPDSTAFTVDAATNRLRTRTTVTGSQVTRHDVTHDANGARTHEWTAGALERRYYYDAAGRTSGVRYVTNWVDALGTPRRDTLGGPDGCAYGPDGEGLRPCQAIGLPALAYDGVNVLGIPDGPTGTRLDVVHAPGVDEPLLGLARFQGQWRELLWLTDGRGRQLAVGVQDGAVGGYDPAHLGMDVDQSAEHQLGWSGWQYAGGTRRSVTFAASRHAPPGAGGPDGLALFRHRLYDARSARWTQEDPLGRAGGSNRYVYAENNPVMFTDPFGLKADTLRFNGKKATLVGDDGKVKWSGPAYSGRPGTTSADQGKRNSGPIPEGTYTIDPAKVSHVTGIRAAVRNLLGDWGNYRVPLEPNPGTDTQGRDGFMLHGGDTPGSAGCIDVCKGEATLFPLIQAHDGSITAVVDYP